MCEIRFASNSVICGNHCPVCKNMSSAAVLTSALEVLYTSAKIKCAEHELLITNTVFCLPTRNKTSWMQPRSKHWHFIDYVIVRRKDRQDAIVTKTMCGADCWTDQRLVVSKWNLRIQPARRPQGKKVPKRLDSPS